MIVSWVYTWILPLFWTDIPIEAMQTIENIFALLVGGIVGYFVFYLPFYFIRKSGKLPKFFPWGDKR